MSPSQRGVLYFLGAVSLLVSVACSVVYYVRERTALRGLVPTPTMVPLDYRNSAPTSSSREVRRFSCTSLRLAASSVHVSAPSTFCLTGQFGVRMLVSAR